MKIKKGSEVSFHYELFDEEGNLIDSTYDTDEPVIYVHGEGEIISGLEAFLEGEEAGFSAKVTLAPEDAYGPVLEELQVYAGPDNFDDNVVIEIGATVETEDPEGNPVIFRITDIDEDKVYLDGNHPLAGKTLHYKIEVLEVY
ncbi:MAG: peptidylprolyl isomerase [Thiotrichales bacterium]|nr:peptidylprolyl isomerase [Thiotrichales bacterium]